MAEGFELVRNVRQHLRRSATLLDEGKFDEALAAVESALAIDPQSAAAQALRDRIKAAQRGGATIRSRSDSTPRSFVPQGVNAASWRGFEQRITERRFKAMLDTVNSSIVAGDASAARAALEEARELRPDAEVLGEFEARVAAVPVAFAAPAAKPAPRIWVRAMGAAALFLLGVSLLLGLEWMRPGDTATTVVPATAPAAAPEVPAVSPAQSAQPAPAPHLGSVPIALNYEEESVPAIVGPPEPLMRPTGTAGATAPPPTIAARSLAMRESSPPAVERTIEQREAEVEQPNGPLGEVADDFVAARSTPVAARDAGPAMVPPTAAADTPVTADARRGAPLAATPASAVSIPSGGDQQIRVQEVLRRYARAYGQLDVSAARAVWPSVDERALTRAFQNLSAQQVSFDACEIDIRGAVANASCRGQASYSPKVGKREPRTEPRTWQFELHRDGDAWTIENVDMRRSTGYR